MVHPKGKLIVIEGTDGSGKATQTKKLVARLRREGHIVRTLSFPQYGRESSFFVRQYLTGRYGAMERTGPFRASVFFAVDRFDAGRKIKNWLDKGYVVVLDRYVGSNMAHQGSRIGNLKSRQGYFRWLNDLEFGILGIPRPDLNLVLRVPARIAYGLVGRKAKRKYLKKKRDLHEANLAHLVATEKAYLQMVNSYPAVFKLIECVKSDKLLSREEIGERVWGAVRRVLA